jgi:hypothetical protein
MLLDHSASGSLLAQIPGSLVDVSTLEWGERGYTPG